MLALRPLRQPPPVEGAGRVGATQRPPHPRLGFEHQVELLLDVEEAAGSSGSTPQPAPTADLPITLELVEALRQWDRKQKFFRLESAEFLGQIAHGQISLSNAHVAGKVRWMVGRAMQKDFHFQQVTDRQRGPKADTALVNLRHRPAH